MRTKVHSFDLQYDFHHNCLEIMTHKDSKHAGATKDELINIYSSSGCDIIEREPFSSFAIKLSDEVVVRFDIQVKKVEAKILKKVYDIVRIRRIYHFFNCNSLEYIVMKYVKNRIIDPLESPKLINKIALTAKIS